MYPGVKSVKPLSDFKLLLIFENNEERIFDMSSFLNKGIFKELRDTRKFNTVHVSFDTIQWDNGADLCPEILYSESLQTRHKSTKS
ncbi:MAG: DUF2442 domain-containing protein [Acidobacteria bacterium]|jgi:hypothetical protein|nr:DUF2442 domain-containing protein [Acidobacteriota bacterium]